MQSGCCIDSSLRFKTAVCHLNKIDKHLVCFSTFALKANTCTQGHIMGVLRVHDKITWHINVLYRGSNCCL